MRPLKIISSSFLIIGGVIGAGFITGRELLSFIGVNNASGIISLCLFTFAFVRILFAFPLNSPIEKLFKYMAASSNFIIVSAMLACADGLFGAVFNLPAKLPIISIILLSACVWICLDGIKRIEKFSLFVVGFTVAVIVVLSLIYRGKFAPQNNFSFSPIMYSSINLFLSSTIIKETGKSLSRREKTAVSFTVSAIIGACAYCVLSVLSSGKNIDGDMPIIARFSDNLWVKTLCAVCIICGIFTTLTSSFYASVSVLNEKGFSSCKTIAVGVGAFALSRTGFSYIVDFLYPVIGVFGLIYIFINVWLQVFSRLKRCRHTSRRQVRTE